jgi:hypothetical protein
MHLRDFFKSEEHAASVVIWGLATVGGLAFVAALLAMALMK